VTPVASTAERIAQRVIHTDRASKPNLLVDTLRNEPIERAIVFTRTKHGADKVVRGLVKAGIDAEAIHGNKSQGQRERVMASFRAGRIRTLIATDIAARGIDVDGITHVINYDLPNEPESYVHRIGRTARAGAEGIAISFCDAEEFAYLRSIEKLIGLSIPASGEAPRQAQRQARPQQQNRRPGQGRPHRAEGGHERAEQKPRGQRQRRRRSQNGQAAAGNTPSNHRGNGQHGRAEASSTPHNGEISGVAFLQRRDKQPSRNPQAAR
jgi:ATP-dependent RNA helicase RhlE